MASQRGSDRFGGEPLRGVPVIDRDQLLQTPTQRFDFLDQPFATLTTHLTDRGDVHVGRRVFVEIDQPGFGRDLTEFSADTLDLLVQGRTARITQIEALLELAPDLRQHRRRIRGIRDT